MQFPVELMDGRYIYPLTMRTWALVNEQLFSRFDTICNAFLEWPS